jgi:hypothetical protein
MEHAHAEAQRLQDDQQQQQQQQQQQECIILPASKRPIGIIQSSDPRRAPSCYKTTV